MKRFDLNQEMKSFLDDFDKFMEYIASNEVTIGKVTKFISPKFLFEINKIVKIKQENVKNKSTQRAYPLLHLFCNLSIGGKLFREEIIKGGKTILKPTERFTLFKNLNDIEKYIALVEMLWVDCDFENLGYQTYDSINAYSTMEILAHISSSRPDEIIYADSIMRYRSTILLYFSYFGLINIKEDKEEEKEKNERFFAQVRL
ncbi:hypothetical protein ACFIJ5_13800 [Haloimpatiens sp. FM7330]|uniref:hypothetical protein n=1 Tax=Haloimpatiens sp. FM7330 TaxID=3298610 RepID=UPI00362C1677